MRFVRIIVAPAFVLLTIAALSQTGTLTVGATVVGSVLLRVQSASQTASGAGTATLTASLGPVSQMRSAPSGYTLDRDASKATLTSTIQSRAVKANLPDSGYTLTARLEHPAPRGVDVAAERRGALAGECVGGRVGSLRCH